MLHADPEANHFKKSRTIERLVPKVLAFTMGMSFLLNTSCSSGTKQKFSGQTKPATSMNSTEYSQSLSSALQDEVFLASVEKAMDAPLSEQFNQMLAGIPTGTVIVNGVAIEGLRERLESNRAFYEMLNDQYGTVGAYLNAMDSNPLNVSASEIQEWIEKGLAALESNSQLRLAADDENAQPSGWWDKAKSAAGKMINCNNVKSASSAYDDLSSGRAGQTLGVFSNACNDLRFPNNPIKRLATDEIKFACDAGQTAGQVGSFVMSGVASLASIHCEESDLEPVGTSLN